MTELLNNLLGIPDGSTSLSISVIGTRLGMAAVLGALVGLEREWKQRPAGLRTHILVCLSAATVAILTIEITHMQAFQEEAVRIDAIRLVEAVTAGVAFLAAGVIVCSRGEVHGLTTGAGMWLASAIGLATGLGFWRIAILTTLLAIAVLWLLRIFERHFVPDDEKHYRPRRRRKNWAGRGDANKAKPEGER